MKEKNQSYEKEAFQTLVNELAQTETSKKQGAEGKEEYIELERLNLPARSEVHQSASFRLSIPSEHPLTRLVFACMFITGVCLLAYFVLGEQLFVIFE